MSDTAMTAVGAVFGLVLLVVIGLLYRWRRRRSIAGAGLAVVPVPAEDWTDLDVDRLLAALQSADRECEEAMEEYQRAAEDLDETYRRMGRAIRRIEETEGDE